MIEFDANKLRKSLHDREYLNRLKMFLNTKSVKESIDTNNWFAVYRDWLNSSLRFPLSYLISALLLAGIDVLQYLRQIPQDFLASKEGIYKIYVPDNIVEIDNNTFYGCKDLKEISLPDSLDYLDPNFLGGHIDPIIKYRGTKKDCMDLLQVSGWYNYNDGTLFYCTDGRFIFMEKK